MADLSSSQAFPFDPNPSWSKFYADGDEILDYMKEICDKWDLRKNIQFNTRVVATEWLEEEGKWKVTVEKGGQRRDEYADILVSAQGFLRWVYLEQCTLRMAVLTLIAAGSGPTSLEFTVSRATKYILQTGITALITPTSE